MTIKTIIVNHAISLKEMIPAEYVLFLFYAAENRFWSSAVVSYYHLHCISVSGKTGTYDFYIAYPSSLDVKFGSG